MKKRTAFFGILGLIIFALASIIKQFSPDTISDFYYGFFSGIAFVCIVVMIILFGSDISNFFKRIIKRRIIKRKIIRRKHEPTIPSEPYEEM